MKTFIVTDAGKPQIGVMKMNRRQCEKALDDIKFLGGVNIPVEALEIITRLIEQHFDNHNNTDEFEHFKPFSDGTLKSMTKADLIDYIHVLLHNWSATDESYNNVMEYARKLQKELDNQLLKFEDLQEGMWVWDSKEKSYIYIFKLLSWEPTYGIRYANHNKNYQK